MALEPPIRILHLEDDPDYCQLVRDSLAAEKLAAEVVAVDDRAGFEAALAGGSFDLILGDYSLPSYSGLEALATAGKRAPQTPFLLVSGTIGEQAAIESLRAGATDYVLKYWPDRLVPAIRRAVESAREQRERTRQESEQIRKEYHYRSVTDRVQDVVSLLDADGRFLYNTSSIQHMLGVPPEALTGRSLFDLVHPDEANRIRQAFQHGLEHPAETMVMEFSCRHGKGCWVHLEVVGEVRLQDPAVNAVVLNLRDATGRRRLELRHQALYHLGRQLSCVSSRHEAAGLIRDATDQLFNWDVFTLDLHDLEKNETRPILNVDTVDGKRVVVETPGGKHETSALARRIMERGAELILASSPETTQAESRPFGDISRASASLLFAPIRSRHQPIGLLSVQSYTANAYQPRDLETLQVLADHCGGALERIAAEEALRASESRFREIFANSPDAIFVEDLRGFVLDVNPAGCRLHGLSRAELVNRHVSELVPVEQRRDVTREFQRVVEGEVSRIEGDSLAADGRVTPVELRATRIEYNGQPALLLHVRDISERKQAEAALRSSEMLFHAVWENSVDGMRLTDEGGLIVAVNEAYCRLVGLSRAELEGNPFTVIHADLAQPEPLLEDYTRRFQARDLERQAECRLTLRDGREVVLEDTSSFVELRGQPPRLLGVFRDVTGQKRLEEQLRHSQKMEAIGQLAGGVAHDFNNLLTVIHGHASMLATGLEDDGALARSAQQIVQAADRAAGLTRQLLTFSRRQVMQPRRLDLNEIVANMTRMLGRILGEDVVLQVSYSPKPAMVLADAGMLEQVLLNLAVNARDAMPRGGQLRLRLSMEELAGAATRPQLLAPSGTFVCLTVQDTGCGIPPEILRRIFEPFFTTKEVGKGTGLGLATVYGIVEQHQGWIEVESQLGRGTTFRVYLPPCALPPAADEPKAEAPVRGGHETILVVEDEPPVRELVCSVLLDHGYRVLAAESGARALEVWRTHRAEIALLLTDVVMPEQINGRELAERLRGDRPDLKVVFTSGYSVDLVGRDWMRQRGFDYVQKPYAPRRLVQAVRDCLDATEALVRD